MGNIINLKKMMSAAMFAAGLLVSMNSASAQQDEQEPLALLQLDVDGNGSLETVELYGGQMTRGSSYRNDFLLLLKGSDSELLTAYVPSINGGYDCSLDNAGVAATAEFVPDFRSKIAFADGSTNYELLPKEKEFYEQRGLYDVDGTLLKGYRRPYVGKIHSLVAVDMGQDGILELLSLQNISGLNREDLLGKLAGVWSYDGSSGWKLKSKTFYSGGKNKDDKFHRSYNEKNWRILPRQAVHDSSSVTYPVFTAIAAPEVQNKLNGDFAIIAGPYLQNLATGGCELDYTLTFVSEKFISMVFFGVLDEGEKEIFAKIPLNIDVQTGAQLALGDVLNLRDADLLPVLRLLTKKDKVDFSKGIPESWYYNGTNFVFCQRSETGEWLEATVAASDLKKFLLKPELF